MTITGSIIQPIADQEGISPTDLPPLYDTVDPEPLQAFVASPLEDVDLTFVYSGYTVRVSAAGEVAVEPVKPPQSKRV